MHQSQTTKVLLIPIHSQSHIFFYCNTRKDVTYKNTKKKIRPLLTTYCTNAKLRTIQYLRFLQIRHCILFTTLTLLTIQYLRYLQYDTYTSYNTIFVLPTVKNIFFKLTIRL